MSAATADAPVALVTGATGFTGGHLARRLLAEGHRLVLPVRPSRPASASRPEVLDLPGVTVVECDLTSRGDVRRLFEGRPPPDAVFHVAAAFRRQHADMSHFRRANVDATGYLVDGAVETGVRRFVHCSTAGVQGEIDDPPADEAYRVKPGDVYQRTKLEGERQALDALDRGLAVSVIRPVGIYGPGDRRFLKLFRAIARRRMLVIGDGETLYHLTHVCDVVEGLRLAAAQDAAVGEVFTIAGARYTTLNELFELIALAVGVAPPRLRVPYAPVYGASWVCDRLCRAIGVDPPLYPRRVEFFSKDRAFSIDKARRVLGYEPAVSLEEGLSDTFRWYRREGLL